MRPVVYDAGALVAADRNERRMWAEHRVRLELGMIPAVSVCVVAQVSRSPNQAQLRRLLVGCEVVAFAEKDAHEAGRMLATAKTNDVVDAAVVGLAVRRQAAVVTGDAKDLSKLAASVPTRLELIEI